MYMYIHEITSPICYHHMRFCCWQYYSLTCTQSHPPLMQFDSVPLGLVWTLVPLMSISTDSAKLSFFQIAAALVFDFLIVNLTCNNMREGGGSWITCTCSIARCNCKRLQCASNRHCNKNYFYSEVYQVDKLQQIILDTNPLTEIWQVHVHVHAWSRFSVQSEVK